MAGAKDNWRSNGPGATEHTVGHDGASEFILASRAQRHNLRLPWHISICIISVLQGWSTAASLHKLLRR